MPFGDVTNIVLAMDFDMIPRLIFWGTALGHDFIPFLSITKLQINTQHYPMIVKLFMVDQLPHTEFRFEFFHDQ